MGRAYKILFLVIIPEIIAIYDPLHIGRTTDYCQVETCNTPHEHIACRYLFDLNQPGEKCVLLEKVLSMSLKPSEKARILKRHNEIRQFVAAGKEWRGAPGPQPRAVFMPNLTWDDELANLAQRWANQCPFHEDNCRDVARFRVGQNTEFAIYNPIFDSVDIRNLESFINLWYRQVEYFNKSNVGDYVFNEYNSTAKYAQIVWADTKTIGCGKMKYQKKDSQYVLVLVCNYGPGGINEKQRVYKAVERKSYRATEPESEVLKKKDTFNDSSFDKQNGNIILNMIDTNATINIYIN